MSIEESRHRLKPIIDINDPHVQALGELAVENLYSKNSGEKLKFVRVVNGLKSDKYIGPGFTEVILYHLVLEAKTNEEINWTYATKLEEVSGGLIRHVFLSFEPVLPYYKP
ncbi:hypothetical protein Csa_012607 [Cucumis sativus]|uniref:Cystatin domain-containing protein n=1 Tax=Cucumis sativus TaxID=3659 RepID=A0A0A0KZ98_CUCSA|nr:hypothetical protein Csa_012607 [Cucumis sativus]